jgi:WD40 repeat protein
MALVGGLIIAVILTVFALIQRQTANVQAGILLASQAESELEDGKSDLAILLALAALEEYPYTAQAEHALGQAVTYNRSLNIYEGHSAAVTGADWSSDGTRVATISTDNSVHIWDAATGELIRKINLPKGITGNVYDWGLTVKWTPDDQYLLTISGDRYLTGSQDYDLFLWDVQTGEQTVSVEVQNSRPSSSAGLGTNIEHFMTGAAASFASDGRAATLGGDNTALIWNPMLTTQQLVLKGHTQGINALDWSTDFTRLATASEDGTARIWDTENGQELMQLVGHNGGVNQVAWAQNKNLIATAGDDGNLIVWDGITGEKLSVIQITPSTVNMTSTDRIVWSLTWSPDGSSIATGSGDGFIRIMDVDSGEMSIEIKGHDQFITYLDWAPNEDCLISTSTDGKARIWSVTRDNMLFSLPYGFAYVDWSPDGKHFAVGTTPDMDLVGKGMITVWDFETVKPIFETFADKDENWGWGWVEYSSDGNYLLSRTNLQWPDRTDTNKYYIFDSQTGEIIRKLETNKDTLLLMGGWSPDGQMVAAGDYEGTVYFWEVNSGEIVKTMNCLSWGHIFQWSPDGSKIAMICMDFENNRNAIQVVDANTYELLFSIDRDIMLDYFQWIRWSPDSTRIAASGGSDEFGQITNPVYVFDAKTGVELLNINRHTSMVMGIGWSPDGKRLVSSSTDDTTRIWDAETGAELLTLTTPGDWYTIPDWSPDGKYVFVSVANLNSPGKTGVFRVWQTKEDLINYAKECCVFRELTDAERMQFGLD